MKAHAIRKAMLQALPWLLPLPSSALAATTREKALENLRTATTAEGSLIRHNLNGIIEQITTLGGFLTTGIILLAVFGLIVMAISALLGKSIGSRLVSAGACLLLITMTGAIANFFVAPAQ